MNLVLTKGCPHPVILQRFLQEKLADDVEASIESHVSHCTSCQQYIQQLAGGTSIEELLRGKARFLFGEGQNLRHSPSWQRVNDNCHPMPDTATDSQPERIAEFHVLGELGRGAFGIVYHAYDDALDRPVAIKVPNAAIVEAAGGTEMYLEEARTLAQLDHPHIVRVFEAGTDDDSCCYVASQFIDGCSLAHRLDEGLFEPDEAVRLMIPLAEALQHAHERGIYHRDVKPANILLDATQTPCLADFGLALKEEQVGRGPHIAGTPDYMSPEQAHGRSHRVDGRTDIFSLGVVFFKLLTGERPSVVRSIVDRPEVQIDDAELFDASGISADLQAMIGKCIQWHPEDRYATARELAEDLRRYEQGLPVSARPVGRLTRLWRLWRHRPVVPTLAASIALLVCALIAAMLPAVPHRTHDMRIAIKPWVGFSPLVVAAELGLCEDVDVQLVPVRNTMDVRQRVMARDVDIAPYLVDSHALARAMHTPTRIILKLDLSLTADAMIATDGIRSFSDLRGKRVAYMHHEAPHFLLLSLCELHGVSVSEFEHVLTETAKEAVDEFVVGNTDAVVSYEPFLQAALDRPGAHRLASAADDPGSIIDILAVREEFLETERDKVESLIAAWFEALDLLEHRDPLALEIACRFLGTDEEPVSIDEYDEMVRGMRYAGIEENLQFFRLRPGGHSEFRDRFNTAQHRWTRHHQLSRMTDPAEGDASEVFLEMYGE